VTGKSHWGPQIKLGESACTKEERKRSEGPKLDSAGYIRT
jgi:hypothetical protein